MDQWKSYIYSTTNILCPSWQKPLVINILYRKETKHVIQKRNKTWYVQDGSKEITNNKNKLIGACPKLAKTCTEKDTSETGHKLSYNA